MVGVGGVDDGSVVTVLAVMMVLVKFKVGGVLLY